MPTLFHGAIWQDSLLFGLWLVLLIGLVALLVYDLRWMLLPNRLLYPTGAVAGLLALLTISNVPRPLLALANTGLAIVIGGGIFYLLFQVSGGKWIGGGDIKLGGLLGLIVATPSRSLLFIFIAAVAGTLVSLPLLLSGRLKPTSTIPFGPFLIAGGIITFLFGGSIIHWYTHLVLLNS